MPTYGYVCTCGVEIDAVRPVDQRDDLPQCPGCQQEMRRSLAAPLFRFAGRVTPGGGPDKFTADALGVPLAELPDGLKTPAPRE